ncbi:MAG: HEAT repeat domain-containing protein [Bryobacteraceae bacterium]|nr:HEAT repeat domain-containing protein [Bryobacteraceae bacterium]
MPFRIAALLAAAVLLSAQTSTEGKQKVRQIKELARKGAEAIPQLDPFLADPEWEVRGEAVRSLVEIGTRGSIDPLVKATRDDDAEIQIRATEGLVNFYVPGYVKSGISGSIRRMGNTIQTKWIDSTDTTAIESYVEVRPEVIEALGRLVRGGASLIGRATAARAVGVLRGKAAVPDLLDALRSKDDRLMIESLIALQKIGDGSAGPRVAFLVRDLEERVQVTALETVGLLRATEVAPEVREALERARTPKVRQAALSALSMLPDPANRQIFLPNLSDREDGVRAAAAEGLGRIGNPEDKPAIQAIYDNERSARSKTAQAFALVALGSIDYESFSPLRYLVQTLNSRSWRGVAQAFLIEAARDERVRRKLLENWNGHTKDERIGMGWVLAYSGSKESLQYLEAMSQDQETAISQEGIRALRTLRGRVR